MFFVYIIFSEALNQYYVGESNNLDVRLILHNNHSFANAHTRKAADWKFRWCLPCLSREQARKIEAFIKQMKSRKFIERLIAKDSTWLYEKFPN